MALITCGDAAVQRGRSHMPIRGAWWAELVLDTAEAPTGSVTIEAADGLSIKGTVQEPSGIFLDSAHVRIVGGAGGLGKLCEPRAFQNAQLRDLLSVVTAASGDTLSSTIDGALLATLISAWSSMQIPAAQSLDEICSYVSKARGETINWRYLGDGSLWLGAESWPTSTLPTTDDLLEPDPATGRQVIGAATPSLLPGVNLDGVGNVLAVDHWIESNQIRTWAWTAPNHLVALIGDMVRAIVGLPADPGAPPRIDKLALYPAEVKAASADGKTLDIQPADSRLSGMQKIKLKVGIPGSVATVQPGAIVLLGWENGDPNLPYCMPAWDSGATVTKLVLAATMLHLGAESGSQFVALSNLVSSQLNALKQAISEAGVTPNDGGAAFKTNLLSALSTWPGSTAATKTKAK